MVHGISEFSSKSQLKKTGTRLLKATNIFILLRVNKVFVFQTLYIIVNSTLSRFQLLDVNIM